MPVPAIADHVSVPVLIRKDAGKTNKPQPIVGGYEDKQHYQNRGTESRGVTVKDWHLAAADNGRDSHVDW